MLKLGIVGLPNAGKSTLFNALVKGNQAPAANFPFCTIEPNVGIVEVPDERLEQLAAIVNPAKIVPAAIEVIDIAGLVAGAAQGEGLGNKFLSHIKEANAIAIVLRAFTDADVTHVYGSVDPVRDFETLMLELILSDLQNVSVAAERAARLAHDGKSENKQRAELLGRLQTHLEENRPASEAEWLLESEVGEQLTKELQLITAKPRMLVFNINESDAGSPLTNRQLVEWVEKGQLVSKDFNEEHIIFISSKLESELLNMDNEEQSVFLAEYSLTEPGMHRLITKAYALLGLHSYFTAGPIEVKAWTIPVGAKAPQAAGVIHTDFEQKFIRAETISFTDFIEFKGDLGAREAGKMRSEGKEYVVQDGDVMHFRIAQ